MSGKHQYQEGRDELSRADMMPASKPTTTAPSAIRLLSGGSVAAVFRPREMPGAFPARPRGRWLDAAGGGRFSAHRAVAPAASKPEAVRSRPSVDAGHRLRRCQGPKPASQITREMTSAPALGACHRRRRRIAAVRFPAITASARPRRWHRPERRVAGRRLIRRLSLASFWRGVATVPSDYIWRDHRR